MQLGEVFNDLIVMAMACDVCRVFALEITQSNPNRAIEWPGISRDDVQNPDGAQGLHRLAHAATGDPDRVLFGKVNATYANLYASLLKKLDAVQDGNGRTLLDNSVAVLGNAYGDSSRHDGKDHSWENTPFIVGGSGGGFFQGGKIINAGGKSHTQVLGSVLEYFDIDRSPAPSAPGDGAFGDPGYSYDTLPGLKA